MTNSDSRRRYRMVDPETREDSISTAVLLIEGGSSFTAACRAVAEQVGVSDTAVRKWVNDSGKRPVPTGEAFLELQEKLRAATELNRRLSARLEGCAR